MAVTTSQCSEIQGYNNLILAYLSRIISYIHPLVNGHQDTLQIVLCMARLEALGRAKLGPWGGLMGARGPVSIYERWLGPGLHGSGQQFSLTRKTMRHAFFSPHHSPLTFYCITVPSSCAPPRIFASLLTIDCFFFLYIYRVFFPLHIRV